MRFGCETRLPWSPPRTKTSNTTTTPKSHENPNSSSVKGEATNEGSLGGGFLVKNLGLVLFYATHSRQPQCWVNLQTLPLQVLEATDIGNRRIAAATHSHTLTSLGRFLRRKSVGHAGLNGKWLHVSPLTFVPFAGVPANMRHWRPLLQTLSVKRLAFFFGRGSKGETCEEDASCGTEMQNRLLL